MKTNQFFLETIKKKFAFKKIIPLPGGWRKKTFLIDQKPRRIVCFIPKNSITEEKLRASFNLEEKLKLEGVRGRKLIQIQELDQFWLALLDYLPGEIKWLWSKNESLALGRLSAQLHWKNIFHFDLKPGNLVWRENKIIGLIDFEEAEIGSGEPMADLANTLSWVLTSGGEEEGFFKGYQEKGLKIDHDRIEG